MDVDAEARAGRHVDVLLERRDRPECAGLETSDVHGLGKPLADDPMVSEDRQVPLVPFGYDVEEGGNVDLRETTLVFLWNQPAQIEAPSTPRPAVV